MNNLWNYFYVLMEIWPWILASFVAGVVITLGIIQVLGSGRR